MIHLQCSWTDSVEELKQNYPFAHLLELERGVLEVVLNFQHCYQNYQTLNNENIIFWNYGLLSCKFGTYHCIQNHFDSCHCQDFGLMSAAFDYYYWGHYQNQNYCIQDYNFELVLTESFGGCNCFGLILQNQLASAESYHCSSSLIAFS